MTAVASIVSAISVAIPSVISAWNLLKDLKPASRVDWIVQNFNLDKRFGKRKGYKIGRLIMKYAMNVGLGGMDEQQLYNDIEREFGGKKKVIRTRTVIRGGSTKRGRPRKYAFGGNMKVLG
jgi:hypothetical protein